MRIFYCILMFLCIGTIQAKKRYPAKEILAQCNQQYHQSLRLNPVEKQMQWLHAQHQVDILSKVYANNTTVWQDYYIQLMYMVIYLTPAQSIDVHRTYIDKVEKLVAQLPENYRSLKWYTWRLISTFYVLDNNQAHALQLLENVIMGISLNRPEISQQDSINLQEAMINELFCYEALSPEQARRNIAYLKNMSDKRIPLGIALVHQEYPMIIKLCSSLLQRHDLTLIERIHFARIMYDALQKLPPSEYNTQKMLSLITLQDSIYNDIMRIKNSDYNTYKELQEQTRIQAETDKNNKKQFVHYTRQGSLIGILGLLVIGLLWYLYRRESAHKISIVHQLKKEQNARRKALDEAKEAYQKQVNLVKNLNHDIRVPLNTLIGFSQLLSSPDTLSKKEQEIAGQQIRKSNTQLLELINNLLAIARVETNKMSLQWRHIEVQQLTAPNNWEELIIQMPPTHSLNIVPADSSTMLTTDDRHVRKIVELVVINAVRTSEQNEIVVTSTCDQSLKQLCINISFLRGKQSQEDILEALDPHKKMIDYEDAAKYYLVLARMLSQLINAQLILSVYNSDNITIQLNIPL